MLKEISWEEFLEESLEEFIKKTLKDFLKESLKFWYRQMNLKKPAEDFLTEFPEKFLKTLIQGFLRFSRKKTLEELLNCFRVAFQSDNSSRQIVVFLIDCWTEKPHENSSDSTVDFNSKRAIFEKKIFIASIWIHFFFEIYRKRIFQCIHFLKFFWRNIQRNLKRNT